MRGQRDSASAARFVLAASGKRYKEAPGRSINQFGKGKRKLVKSASVNDYIYDMNVAFQLALFGGLKRLVFLGV